MTGSIRPLALMIALTGLAACEPGPNGMGTAPPGVSQESHDAQVAAKREARNAYYRGPRGGASGR